MCVNNLPRVALDSREARIRTRNLLITSRVRRPNHSATEPHIYVMSIVKFHLNSGCSVVLALWYAVVSSCYAPLLIGGAIKRCFCLTTVCLSRTSGLSREQRPRKTKIGTEVAHVTRDSDTTFKVRGQGHQATLLGVALTLKAAAAVSVGTYSAWESTATLCLLGGACRLCGEERGGAYCVAMRTSC